MTHGGFTVQQTCAISNYVSVYQKTESVKLIRDFMKFFELYCQGWNVTLQACQSKRSGIGATNLHPASNREKEQWIERANTNAPRIDLDRNRNVTYIPRSELWVVF